MKAWHMAAAAITGAAVAIPVYIFVSSPSGPSAKEWHFLRITASVAGMASGLKEVCSINSEPILGALHDRLARWALSKEQKNEIAKMFAEGGTTGLGLSDLSKEECDRAKNTIATAIYDLRN